jgi:ribA/ribD-fused uncharacterized protein
MPRQSIVRFDGEYAFLSNFHPSPVVIRSDRQSLKRIECATVEHGFQACKTHDPVQRRRIATAPTPGEAKRRGRRVSLRSDWDEIRDSVMRALLAQKFRTDSALGQRLLATDGAEIIEGNTWGDRYWGTTDGTGENRLGKLLMVRRAELSAALGMPPRAIEAPAGSRLIVPDPWRRVRHPSGS